MMSILGLFEIQPDMSKVAKAFNDKIRNTPDGEKKNKLKNGFHLALKRQIKRPAMGLLNAAREIDRRGL